MNSIRLGNRSNFQILGFLQGKKIRSAAFPEGPWVLGEEETRPELFYSGNGKDVHSLEDVQLSTRCYGSLLKWKWLATGSYKHEEFRSVNPFTALEQLSKNGLHVVFILA